jgi:hypothetical protein
MRPMLISASPVTARRPSRHGRTRLRRHVHLLWQGRGLGPDAAVLNSTELKPGDRILGHLPTADRHGGYPIDEFCREQ